MSLLSEIAAHHDSEARRSAEREAKTKGRSQRFYASLPWKRMRYRILAENAERHGGPARCELCGVTAKPRAPLNVDHIRCLSKHWELRLDPANLQVLCGNCNHGKLAGPPKDFRKPPKE